MASDLEHDGQASETEDHALLQARALLLATSINAAADPGADSNLFHFGTKYSDGLKLGVTGER
jgi:hypothetical protein